MIQLKTNQIILIILLTLFILPFLFFNGFKKVDNKYKIIHITSVHVHYPTSIQMEKGIHQSFDDNYIEYSYKLYNYNRLKNLSKSQRKEQISNYINNIKPDMIFVSGNMAINDNIELLKTSPYKYTIIGLTKDSAPIPNATGINNYTCYEELIKFITFLNRKIENITIISSNSEKADYLYKKLVYDNDKYNSEKIKHYKAESFNEWKCIITTTQNTSDLYVLFDYDLLKNEFSGKMLPQDVIKWTKHKSQKPEISFYDNLPQYGGFASIYITPYSQGYLAGSKSIQILMGKPLSEIPVSRPDTPVLSINKKRMKMLNIEFDHTNVKNSLNIDIMEN